MIPSKTKQNKWKLIKPGETNKNWQNKIELNKQNQVKPKKWVQMKANESKSNQTGKQNQTKTDKMKYNVSE